MTNKFSALLAAVACAALVTLGGSPASAIVIDNFNAGSGTVTAGDGGTATNTQGGLSSDVLGGVRQMDIPGGTPVSGIGDLSVQANPGGSGVLTFSLDALTSGSVLLTYDAGGAGLGGGAGVDLTDGGASDFFTFTIMNIDQGKVTLIVSVTDLDSTDSETVAGAGVGVEQFNFSAFTGIDFTKVRKVTLEIRGVNGSDLVLDQFETSGLVAAVPEPSTLAMFAVGSVLAGLYRFRRRQRSDLV